MEQNPLGTQFVFLSRADLEALLAKAAESNHQESVDHAAAEVTGNATPAAASSNNDERYLTRQETSQLLHVDFSTLWRWNRDGKLLAYNAGDRRVLYKYADVLAYIRHKENKMVCHDEHL